MASKKIEKLLTKYLINQASFKELDELEIWIKDPINEKEFINYVKTNYAIEYNLKKTDKNKTIDIIDNLIKKEKRIIKIRRIQRFTKYIAIFIGIIIFIYIYKNELFNTSNNDKSTPIIVNTNTVKPGTDKATLTLGDGSQISLEKGESFKTKSANSDGERLIYNTTINKTKEILYEYLTTARGGQFYVKLSDGTQVWLNSESQLKYPVSFKEGETRSVELVYGEAYFDVSPSTLHKGSKFKVLNQSQEVEVFGTEFNVRAYKDETNIYTTLVEGKVAVNIDTKQQTLIPSQQLNLNLSTHNLNIKKVDVYNEVSWKDGIFSFKTMPLKDIVKTLSRWYDVDFVFANKTVEEERFNGVLKKNVKINEILDIIKKFDKIKDYKINEKMIVIK